MFHRKVLIRLIIILFGLGIILLSVFAYRLGLDNDPGWGLRRFQILGAGGALILFGALYWITPAVSRWMGISEAGQGAAVSYPVREVSRSEEAGRISSLWLLLITLGVLWCYVWVMTIGTMAKWPTGRNYYGMLAQAFRQGQTSLLVQPPAELLKLENPYDLNQRKGIDYLWDTSLYQGKYYLYWGPVPAVLGVLFTLVTGRPVSDAGLVLFFVAGTVLFSVLLLRKLFQDGQFQGWVFWGGVLACAINIPLIWLFTHPAYYEASIAGGQFFMTAGFFLFYLAFRSPKLGTGYLSLSALAFGLAGATRISLLPSVVFLAFVIVLYIYFARDRSIRNCMPTFAVVLLPLGMIAISLMFYNYDRFGSVFEFGHRYQLTGLSSTADYGNQMSIHYITPSLYSYVFRPPALSEKFPFVTVPAIKPNMWPSLIHPPENYYYAEPVAGILFIAPLIGFTGILLFRFFWMLINGDVSFKNIRDTEIHVSTWFPASLLGYVLIQTGVLLVFVSSSMRYLFDITPALIVLACMFVGVHTRYFEEKQYWVKAILFLWVLTAVLTVVMGFLIGFTGAQNNFLNKNPQLYSQISDWFGR